MLTSPFFETAFPMTFEVLIFAWELLLSFIIDEDLVKIVWSQFMLYIAASDSFRSSISSQLFFAMHKNGDGASTPRAGGLDSALGDTGPSGLAPCETYFSQVCRCCSCTSILLACHSRSWFFAGCFITRHGFFSAVARIGSV